MKSVEIVPRRGEEVVGEKEGMGLRRIHCVHIWKYHSEILLCN
jgi:hypothetical protein